MDLTHEQLIDALADAQKRIRQLEAANAEFHWVEDALKKRTRDLSERVKELDCLHGVSKLARELTMPLPVLLQRVAEILPAAWQHPDACAARVSWKGKEHKSAGFRETAWNMREEISVHGRRSGTVDVVYTVEKPKASPLGPFLKEERKLLNTVALWLGEIIERRLPAGR